MTDYTINFDPKLDAAIEEARSVNEPNLTAGEYLKIVLEPYLVTYAKQYEPALKVAKAAYDVAVKAVEDKYAPVVKADVDVAEEVKP